MCADIADSVRRQLAGDDTAPRWFHVEAGNGVGKTYICAGLTNWFFDCFAPSLTLTTAPSQDQVKLLLWKDIKSQRPGHLPGRVLPSEPYMEKASNHYAIGRSTDDSGGKGEERSKGKHGPFILHILDEAEGVPEFYWDSVDAMMTGGTVVLAVAIANPKSRSTRFHKLGKRSGVKRYRLSVLDHPNVVSGADVVPGATSRRWVDEQIDHECELTDKHSEDDHTFEVPWRPGIWRPSPKFLTMVMGIAPKNAGDRTVIPTGRYEAATTRTEPATDTDPTWAAIGADVARFGGDYGTGYVRHAGKVWRFGRWAKQDSTQYAGDIKELARDLHSQGVRRLYVRIDGGGGFGGGVIDQIKNDSEFMGLWDADGGEIVVSEVDFGANPIGEDADKAYDNLITQLYYEARETLKGIQIIDAPNELEDDLTARQYKWANKRGVDVKRLEPKEVFRKRVKRSPDDGDGLVLALAPVHLFSDDDGPRVLSL